ncbi:CDGSH iron-sulfur domain-containing protein [Reichenbachiella sp. MALMAid0571]|uniref:CDGSH iron-sulfur domain-containing protein n=1 Tax=Reichenbachiella sp. MALMAid0571 TaxID=3143939 RepID=UPI0032DECF27
MKLPKRAGDKPIEIELEEGKNYAWCTCGLSEAQPFCNGAHKPTALRPMVFTAEESETMYFCVCKQTSNPPYCDGSHSN